MVLLNGSMNFHLCVISLITAPLKNVFPFLPFHLTIYLSLKAKSKSFIPHESVLSLYIS